MPTCPSCTAAALNPLSGLYQLRCLACCARLVASTRPDKHQAQAMLAAISKQPGAPGRAEILACVARSLQKPR